jgi:predicted RNA-binding Zn ribbon-like protein
MVMPPISRANDLPEDLVLPLETGAPWWYWLGGRPAVDFVNTRRERWRRDVETLTSPRDLAEWLVEADLLTAAMPVGRDLLREARELREAIDVAVMAVTARDPVPAAAVKLIDGWLVRAGTRPHLIVGPDGVPTLGERGPTDTPRRALGTIALDAARILGAEAERDRVRICASETCSARFYDRSPAGRRRWCSMSLCGNVAKARRHRSRRREEAAA